MDTKKSTTTPPIPFKFGNHPQNCICPTCTRILNSLRSKPYVQALEAALSSEQGGARRIAGLEARVLSLTGQLQQSQDGAGVLQRTLEESRRHNQELEKKCATKTNESRRWAEKAEALAGEKQTLGVQVISLTQQINALRSDLTTSEAERAQWCENYNQAHNGLHAMTAEASALRQERDRWVGDFNTLSDAHEATQRERDSLRETLEEFTEKNTSLILERHVLQEQVHDLQYPWIPRPVQFLLALILLWGVGLIAHQSGFQAGQGVVR